MLLAGDAELVSQHDWGKPGVTLVDGSSDPDGFLDKADTEGKEGGEFFSSIYAQLTIDSNADGVLCSDEIKTALADSPQKNMIKVMSKDKVIASIDCLN